MGGQTVRELLENLDLFELLTLLKEEMQTTKVKQKEKL
jgi:hypothetical protein